MVLDALEVNLEHRVPFAHDLLPPIVLLLCVSAVVVLLYLFEERRLLGHAFGYDLVLLVSLFPLGLVPAPHLFLLLNLLQQLFLPLLHHFLPYLLLFLLLLSHQFLLFLPLLLKQSLPVFLFFLLLLHEFLVLFLFGLTDLESMGS